MKTTLLALLLAAAGGLCHAPAQTAADPATPTPPPTVRYVVTAADDFVVEVYLNGKPVPTESRQMLAEIFGATTERINVEVKPGDWLVFNVVNNRLRWGGSAYFGVAGMVDADRAAFVSQLGNARWSCCDDPAKVTDFIASAAAAGEPLEPIVNLWLDGPGLMKANAFKDWNGDAVWGKTCNTWIKFVYR